MCPFTRERCTPRCSWRIDDKCAIVVLIERLEQLGKNLKPKSTKKSESKGGGKAAKSK